MNAWLACLVEVILRMNARLARLFEHSLQSNALLARSIVIGASFLCAPAHAAGAAAAEHVHNAGNATMSHSRPSSCTTTSIECASHATGAFAPDGTVWLTWTAAGVVSVASSDDRGTHFGPPIALAPPNPRMDTGPDARAQILIDNKGIILVSYAVFKDTAWNAEVLLSRSTDKGAHFSTPASIANNPASARFPVLLNGGDGRVVAAWLDKRIVAARRTKGVAVDGASLAYAWSQDGGLTFSEPIIGAESSCECCRIGLAEGADRQPIALFRAIFPGSVRDHALIRIGRALSTQGMKPVSQDHWVTNACPHQGPALAVDAKGSLHAAWFTLGDVRQGLFYAHAESYETPFSTPRALGNASHRPARASLLAVGDDVWLAWKEFDGTQASVIVQRSEDQGSHWSNPVTVATSSGYSDHPLLISNGARAWLSWLSRPEGYRLIALEPGP